MLRLLHPTLLALALFVAPMLAVAQEATPTPACPNGEYPAVGALRAADGAVGWSVCSPAEAYRSVIGASDDIVLIEEHGPVDRNGLSERRTIAFAAADGSERWRRSTATTPVPPGPFDGQGIIILSTNDGGVAALVGVDAATGKEQWRLVSSEAPLAHSTTVAVVWEVVQVGGSSQFRGIDRVTGEELWVSDIPLLDESSTMVPRSPAAVLGEVLVVPTGATVSAIDMQTGAKLWQAPRLDHLAAADGTIVGIQGANGPAPSVTALDGASGESLWTAQGRPSYGGLLAVGDGVIVVLNPGSSRSTGLVAYELATGNERWRATPTPFVEPQLINGISLVGLWEEELAVVSTIDGAAIWSATQLFGSSWMNSVGSNGDSVFVAINSLPWGD